MIAYPILALLFYVSFAHQLNFHRKKIRVCGINEKARWAYKEVGMTITMLISHIVFNCNLLIVDSMRDGS